jgi:hypothetical protein
MRRVAARREHQHVQMLANRSERWIAAFFVVFAPVFDDQRRAPVELLGKVEGQATVRRVALALGWVVAQSHLLYPH